MDRISGANDVVVNGKRMWGDRNQQAGITGTFGNALWFNGVQESILGVVEAVGLAPSDGDNGQLLQAIEKLIPSYAGVGGTNGWQQLPNGKLLQWSGGIFSTGNLDYFAFPTRFPNSVLSLVLCEGQSAGWGNPPQPIIYGWSGGAGASGFFGSAVVLSPSGVPSYAHGCGFRMIAVGV